MKALCIVLLILAAVVILVCLTVLYISLINQWINGKPAWRWKVILLLFFCFAILAGSILGLIFLP